MNIQPTNDKIDDIFAQYTRPGSPGCALAVIQDGEIVYKQGYGLANLEHNIPIVPSTIFNIGSMAKQFTAFAIALLADAGKLSLDDDIRQHLPEIHNFEHTITIRHLIHHTSGLRGSFPELLALAEWRDTDATTTEDVYKLLKWQRELNYRPGDEHLYVNSNYVLLALICQQVSGQSFADFCQARIFDPLRMSHSVVNDTIVKIIPGRALSYYADEQENWLYAPLTDSVVGPTNVYTTVEDLHRWDENFYTAQVGGQAVIEQMEKPGKLNNGTELDYAFGLTVGPAHQHKGWQMVEHGGSQGGYSSWMMRFPEYRLSVVVLFNCFLWNMRDYALKVADLFLEEKPASAKPAEQQAVSRQTTVPAALTAAQLETKAGTYYNARHAAIRSITFGEGQLQFQGLGLSPLGENLFYFDVEPQTHVAFSTAKDGSTISMKTITSSGEYRYERVDVISPTPHELAEYAGRYYSPELDIYWTIAARDDHLIAKRRKYVDSKLTPLFTDAFSDDWLPIMEYPTTYLIVFGRDEHNQVSELYVSGNRVRHLKFSKQMVSM